ncbi:MAG: hypothetical protein ABJG41_14920 [Cyclobacteriaceae bacterium]
MKKSAATATALLVLVSTFAPLAANSNGSPKPEKNEPGLTKEFNAVPEARFQDKSFNFSRALASQQSKNGRLIILYNGTDEELIHQTKQGANEATQDGYKVTGLIVGTSSPDVKESIEMYYNGQAVTYRYDAKMENLDKSVEKNVVSLHDGEIIPAIASVKTEKSKATERIAGLN